MNIKHHTLTALILLSYPMLLHGQKKAAGIDPAASREMIRQWVESERLLSEEGNSWKVEKQRMQDLLDLYEKELKLLDEEIGKAGTSAGLADERKEKLEYELKAYRAAQRMLAETLSRLLPRAQGLIGQLPAPLHEELAEDIDFLNSAEAMAKPREVLKSMLEVLMSAGRFNRTITLAEETRERSEGGRITVNVIYLGLARSFYTTASGDTAGIGTPGERGWKWEERPEIADAVRRTIAVYEKGKQPQLIQLPVEIKVAE